MSRRTECGIEGCPLHERGDGLPGTCRAWGGGRFDFAEILNAGPPGLGMASPEDGEERCPFVEQELRPIVRRVARRGLSRGFEREDLLARVVCEVLHARQRRVDGKKGRQVPATPAALQRFVEEVRVDLVREVDGRMRCTGCAHYEKHPKQAGGQCGLRTTSTGLDHPHFGRELDARTEPKQLGCGEFADRRKVAELPPVVSAPVRRDSHEDERFERAFQRLQAENPSGALLLAEVEMSGTSIEALAERLPIGVAEIQQRVLSARRRLRAILAESEVGHA